MNRSYLRALRKISAAGAMTLLVAVCLLTGLASAQQVAGVAGKWKMVSTTGNGDVVDWTLSVKQDGSAWSATVNSGDGEASAKDVRVDGAAIHMKTPYRGEFYDIDLKLDGDQLTGKWSGNGDTGPTKGSRMPQPAAQ